MTAVLTLKTSILYNILVVFRCYMLRCLKWRTLAFSSLSRTTSDHMTQIWRPHPTLQSIWKQETQALLSFNLCFLSQHNNNFCLDWCRKIKESMGCFSVKVNFFAHSMAQGKKTAPLEMDDMPSPCSNIQEAVIQKYTVRGKNVVSLSGVSILICKWGNKQPQDTVGFCSETSNAWQTAGGVHVGSVVSQSLQSSDVFGKSRVEGRK